jgi:hypothetical protein
MNALPLRRRRPRFRHLVSTAVALALLALGATAAPTLAQEDAPASGAAEAVAVTAPVAIEAIEIAPESPGAETLCKLTLRLKNTGDRPLSGMGFDVVVNGQPLTVYGNQLFYQLVPAGETVAVPLFNFWTSETGRAAPADGKLPVEITLRDATWMKVSIDDDGVETWQVLEAVPGLPVSATRTLSLAPPAPASKTAPAPTAGDSTGDSASAPGASAPDPGQRLERR